ncbi:hypothetical protein DEO72_LG5g3399 [Vigna unguiculata]|uniref:Uncharacterized protein n=1 Tax=Vigna unguiculata TaxID=3917 RepID=A0A4D6M2I1_VIGUN|nr:hypothetical protein DEO72_LG5g3399 [Vigna unguiculata]
MATRTSARVRERKKENRKTMGRPDFVKKNCFEAGNARSGKDRRVHFTSISLQELNGVE